jgi:hypothetical protein
MLVTSETAQPDPSWNQRPQISGSGPLHRDVLEICKQSLSKWHPLSLSHPCS